MDWYIQLLSENLCDTDCYDNGESDIIDGDDQDYYGGDSDDDDSDLLIVMTMI